LLSWDPGTLQASYALLQLAAGGAAVIPVPGGATATSASADVPLQEALACFQLFAFDGATQLLTASDVDCLLPGFVTGLAPTNFRIRLTQSNTATLAWDGVPGASGYVLVALGTNRAQALPPGTLSTPDPTGGIATCYLLLVQAAGGAPVGLSNMVCGIPGLHLGHAAQSSPSSVARPQAAASDARRPVTGRPVLVPTIPRPSTPEPMPTAVRRRQ
jgi:hypothetical protein